MAQQLQVNLSFTADANKAKAQIENLQKSLNNLMKSTANGVTKTFMNQFDMDSKQAIQTVSQLQAILKQTVNTDTGKLNLTSFHNSLKENNLSLQDFQKSLVAFGPAGEKAFANLAKSIMSAEAPLKQTGALLDNLWISLKNTARWQLSSSLIKQLVGAFSDAFSYAKDLNESLNNIQIVTGNSADEMANFAAQANRAAKELSTTTTAYTDASLIYYQQGLDDESVKARTDLTIKAANAAGTNAAEMADYLTAVWNSYKVGTDDLERYVDIMAALGAGTATSLEEISTSMEKVASVGEATGVKFEQMASIIATVSSVTRQSAESVGTAFKTIFARMADLKLGGSVEEDGVTTDLGTVSKQLNQIGINILDANGDLRDMGDVMEELMSKWNGMNEATQQAVAIALAGKRQYTQLLALMNNQDLYQQSMGIATGSEGTLEKQADIYAQSWEAARKRVKAAWEGIFDSLINSDFFIDLNNGLATFLTGIENTIDKIGGFKGVLVSLGGVVLTLFNKQIVSGINNTIASIQNMTKAGRAAIEAQRQEASKLVAGMVVDSASFSGNLVGENQAQVITKTNRLYTEYVKNASKMSDLSKATVEFLLDQHDAIGKNIVKLAEEAATAEKVNASFKASLSKITLAGDQEDFGTRLTKRSLEAANSKNLQNNINALAPQIDTTSIQNLKAYLTDINTIYGELGSSFEEAFGRSVTEKIQALNEAIDQFEANGGQSTEAVTQAFEELNKSITKNITSAEKLKIELLNTEGEVQQALVKEAMDNDADLTEADAKERVAQATREYIETLDQENQKKAELNETNAQYEARSRQIKEVIDQTSDLQMKSSDGWIHMAGSAMQATTVIMGVQSAIRTLNDSDMSTSEKLTSIFMSLTITASGLIPIITNLSKTAEAAKVAFSGLNAALGPVGWAILAVAAAIGVANFAYNQHQKAIEDNAKAATELYENMQTLEGEVSTLNGEIDSLTQTLKEQREQGEDTSETYEDLRGKLDDVRSTYQELGVSDTTLEMLDQAEAVGIATDSWTAYAEAQAKAGEEVEKNLQKQAAATAQANFEAAQEDFKGKMGGYSHQFGDSLSAFLGDIELTDEQKEIYKQYNDIINLADDLSGEGHYTGISIDLDSTNANTLLETYSRLQDLQQEIQLNEAFSDDQNRQDVERLNKTLADTSERMGLLKDNIEDLNKYKISDALDLANIDPTKINTIDEYAYTLQQIVNQTKDWFGSTAKAEEQAKAYLNAFGNSTEASAAFNFIENFARKLDTTTNMDDSQIKKRVQDMYDYFKTLTPEDQQLAVNVDLKYIDTVNDFKTVLDDLKEFNVKVGFELDPQQQLESAKGIREQLGDVMEQYSEQGYLTTTQTANFLDENPGGEEFLTKTAEGYALTKEAIDQYNEALENEKKAIDELITPTNLGKDAVVSLGQEIIQMETAGLEGGELNNLISNVKDLTDKCIDGEISVEDYFGQINESLDSFDTSKLTDSDLTAFTDDVMPTLLKGIANFGSKMAEAFDEGKIGATEYRKNLRQTAESVLEVQSTALKATESTKDFKNEVKKMPDGKFESLSEEADDMAEALNDNIELSNDLHDALDDMNDMDPIMSAVTADYDDLQELFNEDFTVEVDSSQLDECISKTQDFRDNAAAAFASLSTEAQTNVIDLLLQTGDSMGYVANESNRAATEAYNFQSVGTASFTALGDSASRADTAVEFAAIDMLNGTYVASTENTQLTADAMGLILKSGASTTQTVAKLVGNAIEALGRLISNFQAQIKLGPKEITWEDAKWDVTPLGPSLSIKLPHVTLGIEGSLTGSSASDFSEVVGSLSAAAEMISLSEANSGGMSSYAPSRDLTPGPSGDIDFDPTPDTSGGGSRGGGGSGSGGSGKGSGSSSPKSSGGSSGSGSGSGGSEEKYKSPQKTETQHTDQEEYEDPLRIQDEVDRYQDIDMELTRQERILDRIKDSQDDLYGKDYFAALDKEKAALEEQNALLEKKNEEIQKYNETDIKTLTDLGLTPEFDDQGNITNIEELQAQITELRNQASREATDAKNAAHAAYDAAVNGENASWDATVNGYTDDEGSPEKDAAEEAHDNRIDALEEEHDAEIKSIEDIEEKKQQSYDDAWDAIQNYNDGIDTVFENDMQKEENLRRMREINFEETMKALEIIDDLTQRQIRQIDNLRRRFRNGLFGLADNTDADNAEIGALLNNLNKVGEQKAKLDEQFAKGKISESQYYEGLGDIDDQADELYNSIYDLSEAIGERFVEALDEADERMDESIGKFDHLKSIISSIENLTKLTYGEEDYENLGNLYSNMVDITRNEYLANAAIWEERKNTYETAKQAYEEAVAKGGVNQKVLDQLEENMRQAENSLNEWHEKMYASAEEFAEAINNVYTNTVNQTMDELEKQLTSGKGFDKLQEQLDRLRDYDDDYLTGVNQKYETQRLIRTALQDMDKTDSKVAKNRLDGFIKETQELQKQQKLSKYELGIQERKYDLLLAELALQEAQNSKSQVRLQRDSEGNFNYVYTADEDAILGAQEEYEKAKNDLYNYIREESARIQEEILQSDIDYWEKVNEIAADATMSREEKLKALDELEAYHAQRLLDLNDQLNAGRETSNQAYQDSYALQVYDELATVDEMENAHEEASAEIIDATKELEENTKLYTGQMQQDIQNVSDTLGKYTDTVEKDMQRTTNALNIVQEQTANWAGTMSGLLDLVASRYDNITAACQQAMATISGFMPDIDYFNAMYNSETYDEAFNFGSTREYMVQNNIGGKGKYLANTKGGLNMSWEGENMDMAEIINNSNDYNEIARAVMLREGKINTSGDYYNNVGSTRALLEAKYGGHIPEELLRLIRERNVPGFDTGGYTGDFGPEARIGLLHEKELVLNQADTQNLLDSIELVDRLLNNLEYQNLIHDFDMVNWGQQVSGTGTLEQEVTIHAEFPNVQDRNEIELAITNLTNTAAQYANKRKR